MKTILTLLLSTMVTASWCAAQIPLLPQVQVTFELAEPNYKANFETTAELERFHMQVVTNLESLLADHIGFVRFAPGSNATRMSIVLNSTRPPRRTDLRETFLLYTIVSPDQSSSLQLVFRDKEKYAETIATDTFADEILDRVRSDLRDKQDLFISRLFSHLSLPAEMFVNISTPRAFCIIPFSFEDLHALPGTSFKLVMPSTSGPPTFHGIFAIESAATVFSNVPPAFMRGIVTEERDQALREEKDRHAALTTVTAASSQIRGRGLHVTIYNRQVPTQVRPVRF